MSYYAAAQEEFKLALFPWCLAMSNWECCTVMWWGCVVSARERERVVVCHVCVEEHENLSLSISLQFSFSFNKSRPGWANHDCALTIQRSILFHVSYHQLLLIRPCTGKPADTFSDRPHKLRFFFLWFLTSLKQSSPLRNTSTVHHSTINMHLRPSFHHIRLQSPLKPFTPFPSNGSHNSYPSLIHPHPLINLFFPTKFWRECKRRS